MQIPSQTGCNEEPGDIVTGNVIPLLHEIRHALRALLDEGEETVIDLRGIPLGPGEEAHIEERLGHGEVRVELSFVRCRMGRKQFGAYFLLRERGEGERRDELAGGRCHRHLHVVACSLQCADNIGGFICRNAAGYSYENFFHSIQSSIGNHQSTMS